MGKIELLEKEIQSLTDAELRQFREWFAEYDSAVWDQKIESDIKSGKLDAIAEEALTEHVQGKSKEL